MGKLIYAFNVSLDGFVETTDHSLDWSVVDDELHSWFNDHTRGLAADPKQDELLRDAPALLVRAIAEAPIEERTDPGLIKERIRLEVQRLFRKRAGRRPLGRPVVMEV